MTPRRRTRSTAAILLASLAAFAVTLTGPSAASAIPPDADPKFVQVSASRYSPGISSQDPAGFVLGLTADGDIYSWGKSLEGALGLGGSVLATNTPQRIDLSAVVPVGDKVIKVSAGTTFALALTEQGKVLSWGGNGSGQLGLGDFVSRTVPTEISRSSFPSLGAGKKIISIAAAAGDWALALSNDTNATSGAVYSWGYNAQNQLGVAGTPKTTPQRPTVVNSNIKLIAAGYASGYAVNNSGQLYSWGYNGSGQLGTNNYTNRSTPATTSSGQLSGQSVTAIAAGGEHVIALTQAGRVLTWGAGDEGQLGDNADTERTAAVNITSRVTALLGTGETVTAVAAGDEHTLALTSTGAVLSWGSGSYGALGTGNTSDRSVPGTVTQYPAVVDGAPVSAIAAGDYSTFAVTSSGGVYGTGIQGAIGDATLPTWDAGWGMYLFPQILSFTPIRLGALSGTVAVSPAQATVGQTLTATPSGWGASAALSYQWTRGGSNISGANSASYTTTNDDLNQQLRVTVTAVAENFQAGTADSANVPVGTVPSITTTTLADTEVGTLFMATLAATGSTPLTWSSADLPAWLTLDPATGGLDGIVPDVAGTVSFTVTASSIFGSDDKLLSLTAKPGDPDSLTVTASSTTVNQGDTIELTAIAYDEYGNAIGDVTSQTTFTSDVATDVIVGNRVTFPTASPHTITAESSEHAIGTLLIQVIPASTGGGPGSGGPSGGGIGGLGGGSPLWIAAIGGIALLGGAGAFFAGAVRRRGSAATE